LICTADSRRAAEGPLGKRRGVSGHRADDQRLRPRGHDEGPDQAHQLPQRRHQALQGAGDDARQEEGRRGEGAELLFLVV